MYVHPLNILPRARSEEEKASSDRGLSEAKVLFVSWSCYRFYQQEDRYDDTVVCQWRMLIYLDSLWFNLSLAFGERKAETAASPVATKDWAQCFYGGLSEKIINYLKVEPMINCQLSHPETHSRNKSVRSESSVSFRKDWVRVSRWHVFSSHM